MNLKKYKNQAEQEIKELEAVEKKLKKGISALPGGHLRCATKGKACQYYVGKEYLDKSKMGLAKQLATREYYEALVKEINDKKQALKKLSQIADFNFYGPEDLYTGIHRGRQALVTPIFQSREEYIKKWIETEYDHWVITDEDVNGEWYTVKHERVRSKSERIIADELTHYGVPYRYEYPLELRYRNRSIVKRPDFIALNTRTLEEFIIEHLGMLDRDRYFNDNMDKLGLYESNGYLIGRNVLLLHETATMPLNTRVLDMYIEEYLI